MNTPVRVDAAQIERALVNLLENALEFSPHAVEISIERAPGEVVVLVSDRGPGIAEGERERIFEPFARGKSSGGSGLGLAIARGFVQANAGRLWVEPRGDGTTFLLALPAAPFPARVP